MPESFFRASALVLGAIHAAASMRWDMASFRLATRSTILALEDGGNHRATYSWPRSSPRVWSIRATPRFQRGRCSVTPVSDFVKANRLSTKRFDRYGATSWVTWKASQAFRVDSGVAA